MSRPQKWRLGIRVLTPDGRGWVVGTHATYPQDVLGYAMLHADPIERVTVALDYPYARREYGAAELKEPTMTLPLKNAGMTRQPDTSLIVAEVLLLLAEHARAQRRWQAAKGHDVGPLINHCQDIWNRLRNIDPDWLQTEAAKLNPLIRLAQPTPHKVPQAEDQPPHIQ